MIAVNGRTIMAMDLRVVMDMALIIADDTAPFIQDVQPYERLTPLQSENQLSAATSTIVVENRHTEYEPG